MIQSRDRQPRCPWRGRRGRVRRAGAGRRRSGSAGSSGSIGRLRSTSAGSTRTRAAGELFEFFQPLRGDVSARAGPGADRQRDHAGARPSAHPPPRLPRRPGQIRRAWRRPMLLIMPSYFESLSMVALEAWAMGKPVLANGRCDVLKGQCIRSGAGLYYETYEEFAETLLLTRIERSAARRGWAEWPRVLPSHYAWPVIERKYLDMLERLQQRTGPPRRSNRCPDGWRAAGEDLPPAATCSPRIPGGRRGAAARMTGTTAEAARAPGPRHARLRRRDRQRGARHPARAARRRLRLRDLRRNRRSAARRSHARLPRDGRRGHARRHPHPSFLDRLAGVAHRVRAARPDGARLPQHHAAGVLPRRAQRPREALLPRPPRADGLHRRAAELALGDSEFNRQELEALGFTDDRRPAGRARTSRTWTSAADRSLAGYFDDEWTNIMFVGRVIPNKKFEDVIRAFHAYRTRHNPRSRLLLVGIVRRLREVPRHAAAAGATARHAGRALPRPCQQRGADRALRRGRPVPLRQRARGLLRAVDRGVLQARAGPRLCARPPCRRRWTAAACSTTPRIRSKSPRSWRRSSTTAQLEAAVLASQDAALERLRPQDFGGTLLRFVDRGLGTPPRAGAGVAWDFWQQFDQFERLEELRQFRPRCLPGAARADPAPRAASRFRCTRE